MQVYIVGLLNQLCLWTCSEWTAERWLKKKLILVGRHQKLVAMVTIDWPLLSVVDVVRRQNTKDQKLSCLIWCEVQRQTAGVFFKVISRSCTNHRHIWKHLIPKRHHFFRHLTKWFTTFHRETTKHVSHFRWSHALLRAYFTC